MTVLKIALDFPHSGWPTKEISIPFFKLKFESIGYNRNHSKSEVGLSNLVGPICYRFSQSNSSQTKPSEPQQFTPVLQTNSSQTREFNWGG